MNDFLTTRQVQDLLKVDRITVYRMLNDGRIKGVKIGQQWRFARREVDRLLNGEPAEPENSADVILPVHCVQTIQDLFSDVSQIASLVIDLQGEPITQPSQPGDLFNLLASTPSGMAAYQQEWQAYAGTLNSCAFTSCDGTQTLLAPIRDRGQVVAWFLAGQFTWQPPEPQSQSTHLQRLSEAHHLPLASLQQAALAVPVIPADQRANVEAWPATAARAVESILHERTGFMLRLKKIANLTQIV
jgi:excisionase family DNA binding protein